MIHRFNNWLCDHPLQALVAYSVLSILILLLFFGCAPMTFAKAGATETDLAHDGYDCDQEWNRSGPGIAYAHDPLGSLGYLTMAHGDKEACMQRKGWARTD